MFSFHIVDKNLYLTFLLTCVGLTSLSSVVLGQNSPEKAFWEGAPGRCSKYIYAGDDLTNEGRCVVRMGIDGGLGVRDRTDSKLPHIDFFTDRLNKSGQVRFYFVRTKNDTNGDTEFIVNSMLDLGWRNEIPAKGSCKFSSIDTNNQKIFCDVKTNESNSRTFIISFLHDAKMGDPQIKYCSTNSSSFDMTAPCVYSNRERAFINATNTFFGASTNSINSPINQQSSKDKQFTVLGLTIGGRWPTNLPKCVNSTEQSTRRNKKLCTGSPKKVDNITFIPVIPSENLPGFEFSPLLDEIISPEFTVVVDNKGLVLGLLINEVLTENSKVVDMLNTKFGSENMKIVKKNTQISPGQVVSVLHFYWNLPGLRVHFGPPIKYPQSSAWVIEIISSKTIN